MNVTQLSAECCKVPFVSRGQLLCIETHHVLDQAMDKEIKWSFF